MCNSSQIGNKTPTRTLYIEQGTDWAHAFTINNPDGSPMDLTDVEFSGQMRPSAGSDTVAADFVFDKTDALAGKGVVSLSASATDEIPAGETLQDKASKYQYDFELVDSAGKVHRWLQGPAIVYRGVTR